MAKVEMTKRKGILAMVAIMITAIVLLGGTFAWQSISQEALNEISATVNPGGRLHDDFNNVTDENSVTMEFDKNVYAENYTTLAENGVQIYARVRLDEYMEIGTGAGKENGTAVSLVDGAEFDNRTTWTTYVPGDVESDRFRAYWNLGLDGGTTLYMPTFNKANNSTDPDINGTFDQNFEDYVDYSTYTDENGVTGVGATLTKEATYAAVDEDGKVTTETVSGGEETHAVTETLDSEVITMEDWMALSAEEKVGNYWVMDSDGWFYWASPINPGSATGLLLNGVSRKADVVINEEWYYAINVVGQFITKDNLGKNDRTGFYQDGAGEEPSEDALFLLGTIGVDVDMTADSSEKLSAALLNGGNITLTDNVTVSGVTAIDDTVTLDLGENTVTSENGDSENGAETFSTMVVRADATISAADNGGVSNTAGYAITLKNPTAVLNIESGNFVGGTTAINVVQGTLNIKGGFFQDNGGDHDGEYANGQYLINCIDAHYLDGTAKVVITGGTFVNWNPEAANSENPAADFVPDGYTVTSETKTNGDIWYTVTQD